MTYDAKPVHRDAQPLRPGPLGWAQQHVEPGPGSEDPVLIDCDTCQARGIGCGDCVVTVLLGGPPLGVTLNEEERRALEVLAAAGLIPPLRLAYGVDSPFIEPA